MKPTPDQAFQLALMMSAGMPSREAIRYFLPDGANETERAALHDTWTRSREFQEAILKVQGKPWQGMSSEERIKFAVEKQYAEMAWFLYSRNYAELSGSEKQKADTCRAVLEAKLAGMAGKLDAMSRFYDDFLNGRIKSLLPAALPTLPS